MRLRPEKINDQKYKQKKNRKFDSNLVLEIKKNKMEILPRKNG